MATIKRRNKKNTTAAPEATAMTSGNLGASGSSGALAGYVVARPRRVLRGKRGSLQDLPTMPLDILFEVFAHMEPLDLLNLARTSKDFRDLLLARSSIAFWKAARQNVEGLPECPTFMSEPAYANLLFCSYCHNCLKPNIKAVQWAFMARYCSDCKPTMTISQTALQIPGMQSWDPSVCSILPMIAEQGKRRYMYDRRARLSDVETLRSLLGPVVSDKVKTAEILAAQKERTAAIQKFSACCTEWYENKKETRSQELDQIRRNRLLAIVDKLRGLGWTEELEFMAGSDYFGLSKLPVVKQAKALTDRTWVNVRKPVEDYMHQAKAARLLSVRKGVLRDRLKVLRQVVHKWRQAFNGLFPHARDFVSLPEVRAIVDKPMEEAVSAEDYDVLEPQLPTLVSGWRKSVDERLLDLLKSLSSVKCADDVDILSLATTLLFNCTRCSASRTYPEVLTHCCQHYFLYEENSGEVFDTCANSALNAKPWNPASFRASSEHVGNIITECDKDPARTTQADMDALDARFVCDTCDGQGLVTVMTWRAAAMHLLERHSRTYLPAKLTKAKDEHATMARALEAESADKIAEKEDTRPGGGWQCAHCVSSKFDTKASVTTHVRAEHGKDEISDDDYYRHPDSMPYFPQPVYLISSKQDQAHLPMKVMVAMQSGLVGVRDDIPLDHRPHTHMLFDYDDLLYDSDEPYYGMSEDEDDDEDHWGYPWLY